MNGDRIEGTNEAWDSGLLGESAEHMRLSELSSQLVDDTLGLQMISIRLEKQLIDVLKAIAKENRIGYQPLIRKVLHRFAMSEVKMLLSQYQSEQRPAAPEQSSNDEGAPPRRTQCG